MRGRDRQTDRENIKEKESNRGERKPKLLIHCFFGPGPVKALDTGHLIVLGSEPCTHILTLTHLHFSGGG